MIVITEDGGGTALDLAVTALRQARLAVALTGAGISVGSGIPDFRSRDGLWSRFPPDEYATLDVFQADPVKAWHLFRALARILQNKQPNPAHFALAEIERQGLLHGIVTQNIDGLHQLAGSRTVLEIHGEHRHLHCLRCGVMVPVTDEGVDTDDLPRCASCRYPLKPNVVLFGEAVRAMDEIDALVKRCDLLLVIGTSAQVYPAAGLIPAVKRNGGVIFEFNREQALAGFAFGGREAFTDYYFQGDAEKTLPLLQQALQS